MNKLVYIKGDVLASDERIIVHGCNCFNTMGSGIARQIREKYPEAWQIDQDTVKGDRSKLGDFTYVVGEDDRIIFNAYTQYRYGRDSDVVYLEYEALTQSIDRIFGLVNAASSWSESVDADCPIAMPKIGCGLANGDWDVVSKVLSRLARIHRRDVHVYEL